MARCLSATASRLDEHRKQAGAQRKRKARRKKGVFLELFPPILVAELLVFRVRTPANSVYTSYLWDKARNSAVLGQNWRICAAGSAAGRRFGGGISVWLAVARAEPCA